MAPYTSMISRDVYLSSFNLHLNKKLRNILWNNSNIIIQMQFYKGFDPTILTWNGTLLPLNEITKLFFLSSTFGLKTTFIFWKTAHLTLPCEISAFCTTFATWPLKSCHYCTDRQKSLKLRVNVPKLWVCKLREFSNVPRIYKNHLRSNFLLGIFSFL